MTTTVKLALANFEVYRLFTRELKEGVNFYQQLMNKVGSLIKRCQALHAYPLLRLYQMNEEITQTLQHFYDEIDKFEGVLEKKKHLAGKQFYYKPVHFLEAPFDNALASNLVELVEVYDKLISTLKTLRTAGCFSNDDDYFNNLRRYFKTVNRLLSQLLLSSMKDLPPITLDEVFKQAQSYKAHATLHGQLDWSQLYKALTSHVAPRLEEKTRRPLLALLNQRLQQNPLQPLNRAQEKE